MGELPPYFMARAARLSGQLDEDEEELVELLEAAADKEQMVIFITTILFLLVRQFETNVKVKFEHK